MATLLQDFRYGARMLMRAPGFTAVVVVVLALGIGANSAIFSVVNAVLLRPLPYSDPSNLYHLEQTNPQGRPNGVPVGEVPKPGGAIQQTAFLHWENATISGPQGAENTFGARVSETLFPTLGVQPAVGRGFRSDEFQPAGPGAVILSDRLWSRRYGRDRAIIGSTVMLNGRSMTVAGIMAPDFFFHQNFEFWIPWHVNAAELSDRMMRVPVVVRTSSPEAARAQAEAAMADFPKGWRSRVTSLHERVTAQSRPALLVLLGAVAFVLMIACLNVANLLLARGSDRSREMAIRAALGAGRLRAIRQMLAESLLLSTLGGAGGLLLGWAAVSAIFYFYGERMPIPRMNQTRVDFAVLAFTTGLCICTGLIFGLLPAVQSMRADVIEALKTGTRGAGSGRTLRLVRNGVIVVETALSVVLLVGAGLMLRSFTQLVSADPGFQPEHVLTMRVPAPVSVKERPQQIAHYTRLLEAVQQTPGLNAAGIITPLPLGNMDANATFAVEGKPVPAGERQLVRLRSASAGYFRALGLTLLQGRVLEDSDTQNSGAVAVVSESLVKRYFERENPIGKRISMSTEGKGPWITVIGVVRDVKQMSLADEGSPELYRPYQQFLFSPFGTSLVLRTSADPTAIAAGVQRQIRDIHPEQPINDVYPMTEVVWRSTAQPRFYTFLLGVFAMIALAVAAAGLYGVLSYAVSQRVREIGIRVALGATRRSILRLVVGHALAVVVTGMAIGLAAAYSLSHLLSSQLYQVKPVDLPTYALVCAVLIVVAAVAAWVPARRATHVDPSVALRCD